MAGALPDDFWIDWHPTRSVLADVDEAEWQFLTGSIRELDVGHGYQRDMGRVEAGQLLAVVDNRSRNLDPTNRQSTWWPNLGPLRHVRVCATVGATTYVIWRGFSTSFDPHWAINDAWVVIEGYDSLYAAAKVISESILHTAIAESDPDIWLPLDDGGATTALGLGRSPDATAVSTLKGEPILPYAATPSTRFPYSGGQGSRADLVLPVPSFQPNPAGFTVAAVTASTAGVSQTILAAGPNPPAAASPLGDVVFYVDAAGLFSLWVGNAGGNNLAAIPGTAGNVSTLVIGQYDPSLSDIGVEATIGLRQVGGAPGPWAGAFAPRAGVVRIGAGLDAANSYPFLGNLSHVCLWNRLLGLTGKRKLEHAYFGRAAFNDIQPGLSASARSQAHEVIGWVLDRLGIPAGRRDLDTAGAVVLGATRPDVAAIEMMSRAAATEGGYFFADREGKYTFRLRGATGAVRGTYDTRPGTSGNAALADLTFANDDRSFFTVAKMHVATGVDDGQYVTYRHPNAEVFGEVAYDAPTQFDNVTDAHAAGVLAVGDATPRIDVTEAVIQMGAPGVDADELLGSDLLDGATIVARIPDDAGPGPFMTWGVAPFWGGPEGWAGPGPHTQRSTILFVGHTYNRDTHTWRTRWALTPS